MLNSRERDVLDYVLSRGGYAVPYEIGRALGLGAVVVKEVLDKLVLLRFLVLQGKRYVPEFMGSAFYRYDLETEKTILVREL
jgi:hypothetical protein